MIKSVRRISGLAIMGAAFLMAACASGPPEDVMLKGSMEAVATVNPDGQGRPSPLVIKIYQLKSNDKFELADFFALFDQAEATLGADLLAVEDVMMKPGEIRPYEGAFDPSTRFIGVVAAYRDINQAKWKDVVPMPEREITKFLRRSTLTIKADRLAVSVSAGE
jgi:type VI secretion system protein VasD